MKKIYFIHGWGGSGNSEAWLGWLKKECETKGIKYISFNMPNTDKPKIEEWVEFLKEKIKTEDLDEHTYFVGHSIGCQTILRFIEKLPKHERIGGCVFVAGWFDLINLEPEEMEIAHPWINKDIHFGRILEHCNNFLALFSDNDPFVHLDEVSKFEKNLGAKTIVKHNKGHFNEEKRIPEILEFIN